MTFIEGGRKRGEDVISYDERERECDHFRWKRG